MNITITMNTDNAAFCDIPEIETARILHLLAEKIENYGLKVGSKFTYLDFNGNGIGECKVTK